MSTYDDYNIPNSLADCKAACTLRNVRKIDPNSSSLPMGSEACIKSLNTAKPSRIEITQVVNVALGVGKNYSSLTDVDCMELLAHCVPIFCKADDEFADEHETGCTLLRCANMRWPEKRNKAEVNGDYLEFNDTYRHQTTGMINLRWQMESNGHYKAFAMNEVGGRFANTWVLCFKTVDNMMDTKKMIKVHVAPALCVVDIKGPALLGIWQVAASHCDQDETTTWILSQKNISDPNPGDILLVPTMFPMSMTMADRMMSISRTISRAHGPPEFLTYYKDLVDAYNRNIAGNTNGACCIM
jgi:hypothetical protein